MVQVIPKKLEPQKDIAKIILPWASLLLIIMIVLAYFFVVRKTSNAEAEIKSVEAELKQHKDENFKILERRILVQRNKIDDVLRLLESRKKTSAIFLLLEQYTLPEVYFISFKLNNETNALELSGIARTFVSIGEQIHVFKSAKILENNFIKNIKLKNVSLNDERGIKFKLDIVIAPLGQIGKI